MHLWVGCLMQTEWKGRGDLVSSKNGPEINIFLEMACEPGAATPSMRKTPKIARKTKLWHGFLPHWLSESCAWNWFFSPAGADILIDTLAEFYLLLSAETGIAKGAEWPTMGRLGGMVRTVTFTISTPAPRTEQLRSLCSSYSECNNSSGPIFLNAPSHIPVFLHLSSLEAGSQPFFAGTVPEHWVAIELFQTYCNVKHVSCECCIIT